jgi:hypothetical protein
MWRPFDYSFKEIGAAALISCFVAGGIAAFTGSSVADDAKNVRILVNRTNKGDRLPQAASLRQPSSNLSPAKTALPKRTPLGCDPAFSPVADPERAHIFQRCLS